MAVSQSTRLQVYTWTEDTDEFTRAQMDASHSNIESYAAKLTTGTSLPVVSSAYNRSFFFYCIHLFRNPYIPKSS